MSAIRKLFFGFVCTTMVFFVAACGGNNAPKTDDKPVTTTETTNTQENSNESDTKETSPTKAPTKTNEPESNTENKDTLSVEDLNTSLASLDSYQMHFVFSFEGKDKTSDMQKGTIELNQQVANKSQDMYMKWSTENFAKGTSEPSSFEYYKIGQATYFLTPSTADKEAECVSFSSEENNAQPTELFKPSDVVGGLKDAKLVKRGETVNNITSDHYTFDENSLGFGTFGKAKGDVWVAQDGGYLVKYVGEAEGKDVLQGTQAEGTFSWEYNIDQVNKIAEITLPEVCAKQQAATDIPVPEDATGKASFGSIMTFNSTQSVEALTTFYKEQLGAEGWAEGEGTVMDSVALLVFTKDGRTLNVSISQNQEKDGAVVSINETTE